MASIEDENRDDMSILTEVAILRPEFLEAWDGVGKDAGIGHDEATVTATIQRVFDLLGESEYHKGRLVEETDQAIKDYAHWAVATAKGKNPPYRDLWVGVFSHLKTLAAAYIIVGVMVGIMLSALMAAKAEKDSGGDKC